MSLSKVITVIPTFFTSSNIIDYNMVYKHIQDQVYNQIKSVIILESITGESFCLTQHERIVFSHHIFKNWSDKVNITVGINGTNTAEMVNEIKELDKCSHNLMVSLTGHVKITQEGIFRHYKELIDVSTKPIIIYNNPVNFGINIEPETVQRIYEYSTRVIGIKEASGNMEQIIKIKKNCPNLQIFCGNDNLILPALSLGADGVISVTANIIPRIIDSIVYGFESGNISSIQKIFYSIRNLIELCENDTCPLPLKYILSQHNGEPTMEIVRLPLIIMSDKSKEEINKYVNKICKLTNNLVTK